MSRPKTGSMTLKEIVFGNCDDFEVKGIEQLHGKVEIKVESKQDGSKCPVCFHRSRKVHSYYERMIMDLPTLANETWLKLKARKFFCVNDNCERKVFSERFDDHFGSRKKSTSRVGRKFLKVALLMGGNGGERICRLMQMPVSSSTLIRTIYQQTTVPEVRPKVVGIDDWAFKKRKSYGTVVVDMEQRKIIDLLPDRKMETVKNWLTNQPQVEIVSRDRYVNYANTVTKASGEIKCIP